MGLDRIYSMVCLGAYGLPKVFLEKFWKQMFPSLEAGLQETWRMGRMMSNFNEGLIYIIPKSENVSREMR